MSKPPARKSASGKTNASKTAAAKAPRKTAAAKSPRLRAKARDALDEVQPTDPYVEALAARPAATEPEPEPEELPQPIVEWQPTHQRDDGVHLAKGRTLSAGAAGSLAFGALALAGFAIGAVAIGRLTVGSARARRMEIGHLVVGKISMLRRR
jgi:hypothetical protein